MKLRFVVLLVAGFLFGGVFGFYLLRDNAKTGVSGRAAIQSLPPTVGSPVPEFTLDDLDGGSRSLSSFKGRPVVINFWATWCPPCKEEMPLFERYARKYSGKLVFLGVDSAEKTEIVRPFVANMDITFPVLLDQSRMVSDLYFVKDFPYTFFVDENGTLRGQHIGLMTEEKLVKYLGTIGIEP